MADKYISVEAAIEAVCGGCNEDFENEPCEPSACSIRERLNAIPAADVVERKRGEWMTGNGNPRTYGRIRAMCSSCGAFALYELVNVGSFKEQESNFCPNCGADMRPEDTP